MKVSTQEVFTTDDGKTFTDEAKARAYEAKLKNEVILDKFCASLGTPEVPVTERAKSRMRNDILKFLAFVDSEEATKEEDAKKAA